MEQVAITAQHLDDLHIPLQYYIFDKNGGTIGRDNTNSFCLQDNKLGQRHVSIQYEEGCFTIASIGDNEVFYNESFSKLHAGYETTIELGDTFRAGSYKFSIIDPKDIQEDFIDNKKIINEVAPYNKLDDLNIKPRGQISGLHLNEEKIEYMLTKNKDLEDLAHIPSMQDPYITKDMQHHKQEYTPSKPIEINAITPQYLTALLHNILNTYQADHLPLSEIFAPTREESLTNETMQSIIEETLLVDSVSLANVAILALIIKDLINPLYETLDDICKPILEHSLKEIQHNNKKSLQTLLIKALKKYLDNGLPSN